VTLTPEEACQLVTASVPVFSPNYLRNRELAVIVGWLVRDDVGEALRIVGRVRRREIVGNPPDRVEEVRRRKGPKFAARKAARVSTIVDRVRVVSEEVPAEVGGLVEREFAGLARLDVLRKRVNREGGRDGEAWS
jgi:hypothetical protein